MPFVTVLLETCFVLDAVLISASDSSPFSEYHRIEGEATFIIRVYISDKIPALSYQCSPHYS